MTAWLLFAAVGPALRLASPTAEGAAVVLALDAHGAVATRIVCPRSAWIDPEDAAATLIGVREVLATVIARDGHLTTLEELGPARYACVLQPPETSR